MLSPIVRFGGAFVDVNSQPGSACVSIRTKVFAGGSVL